VLNLPFAFLEAHLASAITQAGSPSGAHPDNMQSKPLDVAMKFFIIVLLLSFGAQLNKKCSTG
jgi:hypothetical protein